MEILSACSTFWACLKYLSNQKFQVHHNRLGVCAPSVKTCQPREKVCVVRKWPDSYFQTARFRILMMDEAVLALARPYHQDILVMPEDENRNTANRRTAYRQFVLWHHGRLGAGDRRVIPRCCMWRIREKFPNPFGQYVGLKK